jgi:aldehyde:ferredoxin oxidoreductase
LKFGNAEAMIQMIHKIAFREGFGDILAEGVRRASRIIGGEAEKYAIHVKGLELPMHDPRAFQGGGPHYACSPTGGRHTEGISIGIETGLVRPALGIREEPDRFSTERKGEIAKIIEDWWTCIAAMGFCIFADVPWSYPSEQHILEVFKAVTGIPLTIEEALLIGERIYNLKRAFCVRHGLSNKDDTLPERLLKMPTKSGAVVHLERTLPQYYQARGWDISTGKPKKETLIKLGLEDVAMDLWGSLNKR